MPRGATRFLYTTIGLAIALVLIAGGPQVASAKGPSTITARAGILIDNQSGQTLWAFNPDQPLPPASTTKVMTALLALQSGRLNDSFWVSPEAAGEPATKIGLRAGWQMRLEDLVYALLLNSANDASVVIAEGLAGSVPDFARKMNTKARLLGAQNTHFANPHGLPDDDHYTSARDLATFFQYAMHDPRFERIVNTKRAEIWPTAGSHRKISLHSHNRLLGNYRIQVVGKTGWTRAARRCFVGSASMGDRQLTFAILGASDLWGDIKRLLEFGFEGADRPDAEPTELQMAAAPSGDERRGGGDKVEPERVSSAGKFSVRLGTFSTLTRAKKIRNSASSKGYPAQIVKLRQHRGSVYGVTVGQYDDRRDAQRAARALTRAHSNLSAFVVSSR